jgi:hypothetical protein
MRTAAVSVALLALVWPISSLAEKTAWETWEHNLRRHCPNNHVEWVADGGYDELIDAFQSSLSVDAQKEVVRIADYRHRCAHEELGFGCEMATYLDAYRRRGLLRLFVEFDCANVKCEEVALCSKFPGRDALSK